MTLVFGNKTVSIFMYLRFEVLFSGVDEKYHQMSIPVQI